METNHNENFSSMHSSFALHFALDKDNRLLSLFIINFGGRFSWTIRFFSAGHPEGAYKFKKKKREKNNMLILQISCFLYLKLRSEC